MPTARKMVAIAYIAPSLVCLVGIIGYPLLQAISTSLYRWNLVSGARRWTGFGNFLNILSDPETARVVLVTLKYTGISVVLELALGLALALLIRHGLAKKWKGFAAFRVLLCVPIVIAPLIWAFYFKSMFSPQFGAFNMFLNWFGISPVPWVNSVSLALPSLIVADAWQWAPFMFAIILAGLLTLPEELTEAALLDGANRYQVFRWIELPLLSPILAIATLIRLIDSIKNIDLMIVITQGGPGTSTETLNYFAYRTSFQDFQIGYGAALSLIVFAVIMLLVIALIAALNRSNQLDAQG